MRRWMRRKAERKERKPASASMMHQPVSRTTWASLTRLRCGSCQPNRTINQCCESQPNQLGVHLAQDAPAILGAPFIHLPILFPAFVQQFHLPAFAQQHERLGKAQSSGCDIREQDGPVGQIQRLLPDLLAASLGFSHQALTSLVANLLGDTQHLQTHREPLANPY